MKRFFSSLKNKSKSQDKSVIKTEKKGEIIKPERKVVASGVHSLYNPIEGEVVDLSRVPEIAFSGKMLGDGFAIMPSEGKVYAPASGEVAALFPTNHAIVILTEEGLEVLIHIGINTATLNGEGFTAHVEKGSKVKQGDLLISFDTELVKQHGKSLITPVIITNSNVVKKLSVDIGNKNVLEKVAEAEVL